MENNKPERTMTLEEVLLLIQEMTFEECIETLHTMEKRRKELQEMMD